MLLASENACHKLSLRFKRKIINIADVVNILENSHTYIAHCVLGYERQRCNKYKRSRKSSSRENQDLKINVFFLLENEYDLWRISTEKCNFYCTAFSILLLLKAHVPFINLKTQVQRMKKLNNEKIANKILKNFQLLCLNKKICECQVAFAMRCLIYHFVLHTLNAAVGFVVQKLICARALISECLFHLFSSEELLYCILEKVCCTNLFTRWCWLEHDAIVELKSEMQFCDTV